jgi:hypothetical protein
MVMSAGAGYGQSVAPTNSLPNLYAGEQFGQLPQGMSNIYGAEVGPRRVMKYVKK